MKNIYTQIYFRTLLLDSKIKHINYSTNKSFNLVCTANYKKIRHSMTQNGILHVPIHCIEFLDEAYTFLLQKQNKIYLPIMHNDSHNRQIYFKNCVVLVIFIFYLIINTFGIILCLQ